ncbi:hypothetical protein [Arthrobacter sp. M4]|uniref:hypothetical protein n=1 Tax=Arthrobacter sp. M4 TaxID=218160 RepID=UPI001CDC1683|nr:hypothetical protein [Arthrobacter sp. M4]MCA4135730.1 hypothetical protein [Arthrobacter sp. M4]
MRVKFLGEENMPWSFLTQWPQNVIETAEGLATPFGITNTSTGSSPASGYCYKGDKQIDNLPAGQYTLEITGINDTTGTYSLELR